MKAIIPAAGIGMRLRPHTYSTPKALLQVSGRPIIAHIFDELTCEGVDEVIVVTGHLGERIEANTRTRHGKLRLTFVLQGEPLGNGHAVYVVPEHLDGSPVLIVFGDTIIKGDMKGLIQSSKVAGRLEKGRGILGGSELSNWT